MVKKYFVQNIAYNKEDECNEDVFAAKKENDYMFLTTPKFKFLDVKNCIGPSLIYDAWCNSTGCRLQKLVFPYECLDSYEKLSHVGPVSYEDFYSNLKSSNITRDEYEQFFKLFKENDCTTMGDWLRVCNVADFVPFIDAFMKMAEQYYPDKIDICKDAVSIPGISMTYMLNKPLEKTKGLSYIHQGVFVTYVKINEKSSSTVVVMVSWSVVVIVKNVSQICKLQKSLSVKRQPFVGC